VVVTGALRVSPGGQGRSDPEKPWAVRVRYERPTSCYVACVRSQGSRGEEWRGPVCSGRFAHSEDELLKETKALSFVKRGSVLQPPRRITASNSEEIPPGDYVAQRVTFVVSCAKLLDQVSFHRVAMCSSSYRFVAALRCAVCEGDFRGTDSKIGLIIAHPLRG
jgi:hypothetical protein